MKLQIICSVIHKYEQNLHHIVSGHKNNHYLYIRFSFSFGFWQHDISEVHFHLKEGKPILKYIFNTDLELKYSMSLTTGTPIANY